MILLDSSQMLIERTFDELGEFAVRDPARLQPGDEVLFLHLPQNGPVKSFWSDPVAFRATVEAVGPGNSPAIHGTRWSSENEPLPWANVVVIYSDDSGKQKYRYATDSGLERYPDGRYNDFNITVLVSELTAQGIKPRLEASEELLERIRKHNARSAY